MPNMISKPLLGALVVACAATVGLAQTKVSAPKNKYTIEQDVQLGREAAAEVRKEMPIMNDGTLSPYVQQLGRRLVAAIPPEFQQPAFQYSFEAVNLREINAFALPGGPMFLHRGMVEAANTEGEVASVMAHEISHVILRHGTAQASKSTPYALGQMGGAILGAIIGGTVGSVVAQGTQFGLGVSFMRFSRAFEKDADIEGAQIMARAGYDPREMANMFQTIEKQGGGGGPEFLSDHPNPGNRSKYILDEAAKLRIERGAVDTSGFNRVLAYLKTLPRAPTTEEAKRNASAAGGGAGRSGSGAGTSPSLPPVSATVAAPSTRYTRYNEGDVFTVNVPSNWRELSAATSVTFAPPGGYGTLNGRNVFTYGVDMGLLRNETHGLEEATDEMLASLRQGNPRMGRAAAYQRVQLPQHPQPALQTTMSNVSEVTGEVETIQVVTTTLRDGVTVFYFLAVAPQKDTNVYLPVFRQVISSVRFLR